MDEPNADEKERLAAKARWIADSLAGKANGHGNGAAKTNGAVEWTEEELNTPATIGMVLQAYKDLRQRLRALEARPGMKYEGVWDDQKVYQRGDFVTKDGSLWHCAETHCGIEPGTRPDTWKLAVKRGKDGKDGSRK
jgi:hypothetical protein